MALILLEISFSNFAELIVELIPLIGLSLKIVETGLSHLEQFF